MGQYYYKIIPLNRVVGTLDMAKYEARLYSKTYIAKDKPIEIHRYSKTKLNGEFIGFYLNGKYRKF